LQRIQQAQQPAAAPAAAFDALQPSSLRTESAAVAAASVQSDSAHAEHAEVDVIDDPVSETDAAVVHPQVEQPVPHAATKKIQPVEDEYVEVDVEPDPEPLTPEPQLLAPASPTPPLVHVEAPVTPEPVEVALDPVAHPVDELDGLVTAREVAHVIEVVTPASAAAATTTVLPHFNHSAFAHPGLDMSHAVGDVDLMPSDPGTAPSERLAAMWMPAHGAMLFLALFTFVCLRRLFVVWRSGNAAAAASGVDSRSAYLSRLLAAVTSWNFVSDRKAAFSSSDSSLHAEQRTALVDGKSRMRKDVKSAAAAVSPHELEDDENLEAGTPNRGSQIELHSLSASLLATVHVPKLIYMRSGATETPATASDESDADATPPPPVDLGPPPPTLLTSELLEQLLPHLPASVQVQDIQCKYKLSLCGASLNDLYRRCDDSDDSLTIVQDHAGHVS
jgi:hypothetical protein